jgi:hypothetical protein
VLILNPSRPGWDAVIWRDGRSYLRKLTDLEAIALLAAWQSPIAPPEPERLSDLR